MQITVISKDGIPLELYFVLHLEKSDRSMSRSQTTGLNPTHTFFALGNLQHGTSRHVVNFTFTSNKLLKIYNMTRGCLTILRFSPQVTFSERLPSVHLA